MAPGVHGQEKTVIVSDDDSVLRAEARAGAKAAGRVRSGRPEGAVSGAMISDDGIAGAVVVIHINDIGERYGRIVPEPFGEGSPDSRQQRTPAGLDARGHGDCVVPERLNLHRLADPRRDLAIAHPRIHPRQLLTADPGREQGIVVHLDAESCACCVASNDCRDRAFERTTLALFEKRLGTFGRIRELKQLTRGHDVPQRCVYGVVLRLLAVIGEPVRQHAFGHGACPTAPGSRAPRPTIHAPGIVHAPR